MSPVCGIFYLVLAFCKFTVSVSVSITITITIRATVTATATATVRIRFTAQNLHYPDILGNCQNPPPRFTFPDT